MATFKRLLSRNIVNTPVKVGGYNATGQVTIIGLVISNTDTETIRASVYLNDGVNNTHIVKGADIPEGGALVVVGGDQKLVMEIGDSIFVHTGESTHTCDAIMSILEV